jgi:hypothetical protein
MLSNINKLANTMLSNINKCIKPNVFSDFYSHSTDTLWATLAQCNALLDDI